MLMNSLDDGYMSVAVLYHDRNTARRRFVLSNYLERSSVPEGVKSINLVGW